MERWIRTTDDVLAMLDQWFAPEADRWTGDGPAAAWWNEFYSDRSKPVPFFADKVDENLAAWVADGLLVPGRALDLGCGPGRNALWLARAGFEVDAIDLSPAAVAWARERARQVGAEVRFACGDAFTAALSASQYDLVYDAGCLHHLPPHRRVSYLALLDRVLVPGGCLGLTCFAAGQMGCELPDEQLYREGQLYGGLAYTPQALRQIFAGFEELELRPMTPQPDDGAAFGVPFLLTALLRRPVRSAT
ncbi:MAG TPA: class I SAM-dependent methyltransferase [Streptosporangiaceae bacterium]|nr:class I SAM-dependent methyltransferase [Streptosporangiaceae bacterium]